MSEDSPGDEKSSRRGFLAAAAGLASAAAQQRLRAAAIPSTAPAAAQIEPFFGPHQAGIITPAQNHTYFAAFDLTAADAKQIAELFRTWTAAAARLSVGQTASDLDTDTTRPASDSGEAIDSAAARLTLTFGFGAGLFIKDGKDRYGLAARRPQAFVDLPTFNGDQLIPAITGGDLSVQACADDPQVAFHAVRQLARLAVGVAQLRWAQSGFLPNRPAGQTPRNLMGFKDGSNNPPIDDPSVMEKFIWVGDEGPDWMRGGSYVVARRIRMALEHWDRMNVGFQQQTIGRCKYSGAPLTGKRESDQPDLAAVDADGNPVIPENSHVRLASAASNDGAKILRRPYSYNDGANFISERWPPWRQGIEYDAGLLFIAYQRDPRTGFIKIFDRMSKFDMLNQFVTHTGGGMFACPVGIAPGEFLGQRLFQSV